MAKQIQQYKNYLGIIRDHTGSMRGLARAAARDYNSTISTFKAETISQGQDTVAFVMQCGVGHAAKNVFEVQNSSIAALKALPEDRYNTDGGATPLFDAVNDTITALMKTPDANEQHVSFVVMATTDGRDNASRVSGQELGRKITQLRFI